MKKLTASIFAGILTVVSVSAADAAVTSKAYVDTKFETKADAATLKNQIGTINKASMGTKTAETIVAGIKEAMDAAAAAQTAAETASSTASDTYLPTATYTSNTTVANDSTYVKKANDVKANLTALDTGLIAAKAQADKGVTDAATAQAAAEAAQAYAEENAGAIETLNADATTEGSVDYKIAQSANTINTEVDKKANKNKNLATQIVTTDATSGDLKKFMPAVDTTAGAGTYVLTATVIGEGDAATATYYWEAIEREETSGN